MRIGLFTDTYRPSINGIVYVVESTKHHLEAMGHEVYVFCPARAMRPGRGDDETLYDDRVIRFPSVKGVFYDDYDTSLFFPPKVLNRIRELDLDIIHFFTPGQIGLMGVYVAYKTETVLVAQHCTDLYEFVEHYTAVLPGLLALLALLPFTFKVDGKDLREIMKLYRPRRGAVEWNQDIVEKTVTMVYKKCDAVIALSRKSKQQLESWQRDENYTYPVTLLPNGVDALPEPSSDELALFRGTWGLLPTDEIFMFVGRIAAEKNLPILIDALERIVATRPHAKLVYVGDFEFRETLERMAAASPVAERIVFTGALPREHLGVAYAACDVFVMPSLTDTQGWVIHEAAHAGRPIVLVDRELSEVMRDGENGFFADNTPDDLAEKITTILGDSELQRRFGARSIELARHYTEPKQIRKLIKLYELALSARSHEPIDYSGLEHGEV